MDKGTKLELLKILGMVIILVALIWGIVWLNTEHKDAVNENNTTSVVEESNSDNGQTESTENQEETNTSENDNSDNSEESNKENEENKEE